MTAHFCTACGVALGPDDHFCASCGHVVGEEAAPASSSSPPPPPESSPTSPPAPVAPPPPPPTAAPPATPAPPAPAMGMAAAPGAPSPAGAAVPWSGPAPAAPAGGSSKAPWIIGAAVIIALALIGGALGLVLLRDDGGDEVVLEATGVEVEDPFTSDVAVDEAPIVAQPTSASGSTAPALATGAGGGAVKGSAPGLYGGTRDETSCDRDQLIAFLQSEPDKAAAWAEVQGIPTEDIAPFVRDLTPVVLRRDTRVVNHGYRDGRATPRPAVLQAGTAVLVDDRGVPRVKCGCGNPLAEPQAVTTSTRYVGDRWAGFDPTQVVVVRIDVTVTTFILIDLETGEPFSRPIGSDGGGDLDAEDAATEPEPDPVDSEGTSAPILFEIASIAAVSNGPTSPSVATLPAARITAITTYHWNDAQGAAPGEISLRGADGTVYGPFPTTGSEGQGGVPNAYWTAITNFRLPAGEYTVVDSDPGTWAWAPDTGGRGMVAIHGVADPSPPTTTRPPTTRPPTTTAPAPTEEDRSAEAIAVVESLYCQSEADWTIYITETRAYEVEFQLYRVEVDIELDSGAWTALFDVDFATEDFPDVRPLNSESGDLLC